MPPCTSKCRWHISKKKYGRLTPHLLKKMLEERASIAVYQRNLDTTVRWICLDFDILKRNLESPKCIPATLELKKRTKDFCLSLDALKIPYLLEVSGNRGFHVWISFSEPISYRASYGLLSAIKKEADFDFDKELIAVDSFPATGIPSTGVGSAVKIPLSKHKKTGQYARLLSSPDCMHRFLHAQLEFN